MSCKPKSSRLKQKRLEMFHFVCNKSGGDESLTSCIKLQGGKKELFTICKFLEANLYRSSQCPHALDFHTRVYILRRQKTWLQVILNHPIQICNIVTAANTSGHTKLNYKLGRTVTVQKNLTLGNSPRMMTESGCEEPRAAVNIRKWLFC